jgi:predicted transposase YbfD/YdcC
MHFTVKKTFEAAKRSGNDLLVQVKRNQPTLHAQLLKHAAQHPAADHHVTHDHGRRNRMERREVSTWILPEGWLGEGWTTLRMLIGVRREIERFDTRQQRWWTSQETTWYVCTRLLSAREGGELVRGHWGIENRCHQVRDVSFGEDASQIRINPEVFAQLRTWALNELRHAGYANIQAGREILALDPNQLLKMFIC